MLKLLAFRHGTSTFFTTSRIVHAVLPIYCSHYLVPLAAVRRDQRYYDALVQRWTDQCAWWRGKDNHAFVTEACFRQPSESWHLPQLSW